MKEKLGKMPAFLLDVLICLIFATADIASLHYGIKRLESNLDGLVPVFWAVIISRISLLTCEVVASKMLYDKRKKNDVLGIILSYAILLSFVCLPCYLIWMRHLELGEYDSLAATYFMLFLSAVSHILLNFKIHKMIERYGFSEEETTPPDQNWKEEIPEETTYEEPDDADILNAAYAERQKLYEDLIHIQSQVHDDYESAEKSMLEVESKKKRIVELDQLIYDITKKAS